jgi:hypothetical protein
MHGGRLHPSEAAPVPALTSNCMWVQRPIIVKYVTPENAASQDCSISWNVEFRQLFIAVYMLNTVKG